MKEGFGVEIDAAGNTFEGYFKANKKTGKGKQWNKDGQLVYEGDFLENK